MTRAKDLEDEKKPGTYSVSTELSEGMNDAAMEHYFLKQKLPRRS